MKGDMSIEEFYNPNEMHLNQIAVGVSLYGAVVGDALALLLRLPAERRDATALGFLLDGAYSSLVEQESVAEIVRRFVRTLLDNLLNRIEDFDAAEDESQ